MNNYIFTRKWVINEGLYDENENPIPSYNILKASDFTELLFKETNIDESNQGKLNRLIEKYKKNIRVICYQINKMNSTLEFILKDKNDKESKLIINLEDLSFILSHVINFQEKTEPKLEVHQGTGDFRVTLKPPINASGSSYDPGSSTNSQSKIIKDPRNTKELNHNRIDSLDENNKAQKQSQEKSNTYKIDSLDENDKAPKQLQQTSNTKQIDAGTFDLLNKISFHLTNEQLLPNIKMEEVESKFVNFVNLLDKNISNKKNLLKCFFLVSNKLNIELIIPKPGDLFDSKFHIPVGEEKDEFLSRGSIKSFDSLGIKKNEIIIQKSRVIVVK